MKKANFYTIKYVAKQTGLKPHVIRVWESRYQVVAPRRTTANHRLYCQTDIKRLMMLKKAVAAGHRISSIASLPNEELKQLVMPFLPPELPDNAPAECNLLQQCWQAVCDLDPDGLEECLCHAATQLSRRNLVEDIITPLFVRIEENQTTGQLKIMHKHLASQYVRTLLLDLLRGPHILRKAPRIVFATLFGQRRHEVDALSLALAAVDAGWRPIYMGTGLPADELAAAAIHLKARALAVNVAPPVEKPQLNLELIKLRRYLGQHIILFAGGSNSKLLKDVPDQANAQPIHSWQDFKETLTLLRAEFSN